MALKGNHLLLLAGTLFVLLGVTVFAHAQSTAVEWSTSIPTLNGYWAYDLSNVADLRDYIVSPDPNTLEYSVIDQSNPDLIDCSVAENYFLSCTKGTFSLDGTTVLVEAVDADGNFADANITINFTDAKPFWTKSIPSQCVNSTNTQLLDLRNFAYDVEDTNANLNFSLTQSTTDGISCSVSQGHFLSCALSTNRIVIDDLNIGVIDSNNSITRTTAVVRTNCFDANGNPGESTAPGQGSILLESDNRDICLAQCTSYGTQVKVTNKTLVRKCLNLATESSSDVLSVSVTPDNVCLNANESAYVTLNANTCNTEQRNYPVRLYETDTNISMNFNYSVGTCSNSEAFRVQGFDGQICQGEEKTLSVFVRNNSSLRQRISLFADNAMVLPYFSKQFIDLESGQQKEVQLTINARNLALGAYNITMLGDGADYHINKVLEANVVDCSAQPTRTFSLNVPSVCYDVAKGSSVSSQFTITSQVPQADTYMVQTRDFFLDIYGMPAELSANSVSLRSGQGRAVSFTVFVPKDASAGHQIITLKGSDGKEWNSFTEEKGICINVLPESKASLVVKTQSMDIAWGSTGVFEVELFNNGDIDSNYTLSSVQSPTGVAVTFSPRTVFVPRGTSKTIFVSVSATAASRIGDNQSATIRATGPLMLSAVIYFNIKEKTALDDLEILSATKEIRMNSNTSAQYDLVLRNNTDFVMTNIVVSFEGLPAGVTGDSITVPQLLPGKTIGVSGKINAGDVNGIFTPSFIVSSAGLKNKKPFSLVIENEGAVGLAALFSLFGGGLVGLVAGSILVAVILIILVAVIVYMSKKVPQAKDSEPWTAK